MLLYLTHPVFILRILWAAACRSVPVEADTGVADRVTLRLHPVLHPSLPRQKTAEYGSNPIWNYTWWLMSHGGQLASNGRGRIYQTFSPDGLHFFPHFQRGWRIKLISKLISDVDLRHESSQCRQLEMDFVFKTSLCQAPTVLQKTVIFFLEGGGGCVLKYVALQGHENSLWMFFSSNKWCKSPTFIQVYF